LTLNAGTYVAIIYVDENGNITNTASTPTATIEAGSTQPATSGGVSSAISEMNIGKSKDIEGVGWYKIAEIGQRNRGFQITIEIATGYYYQVSSSHKIFLEYGWQNLKMVDIANDGAGVFDKIKVCYANNNTDKMGIYLHYNSANVNPCYWNISGATMRLDHYDLVTDSKTWYGELEYNLGTNGVLEDGNTIINTSNTTSSVTSNDGRLVTSAGVSNALYYVPRSYDLTFAGLFSANATVSASDFINKVVDDYGSGVKLLNFIWANSGQGYISIDASTSIRMNGNMMWGEFKYFKEGYNWTRANFFITDIDRSVVWLLDISRDTANITTRFFQL
jgi:hypothetical protein